MPFQRPARFMDRGAQTWGSTALPSGSAWAPTAAYVPRGPGEPVVDIDLEHGYPVRGFRGRVPRDTTA